jgi:hypothetical protein
MNFQQFKESVKEKRNTKREKCASHYGRAAERSPLYHYHPLLKRFDRIIRENSEENQLVIETYIESIMKSSKEHMAILPLILMSEAEFTIAS